MQIHELNRPRQIDEGVMDVVKGIGGAAKTALATAAGIDPNAGAASAGILDPKQKLAAVMKNPDMVKLATQYADEWLKKQAQAVPEAEAVTTYNKKTGRRTLDGKPQTDLSDLPPAVQQRIQAQQQHELEKQTGRSNPYMTPAAQQPETPTPAAAQRFNYTNVAKIPGVANAATATQPTTIASRVNKADPNNPNIKDQTKYVQGRAGSGAGGDATKFAKYDPATSAVATAGQGINNMVKGGVSAQQQAAPTQATAPAKSTDTAMPLKPFQVPGAGTNPNPTPTTSPNTTKPAATAVTTSAKAKYLKDFLEWANQKTAMRDSTTYRTLGLVNAEGSELGPELDAAKEKVKAAQGNPATTKTAVKNYILIAMAALQLVASQNAVKAASTQAPAYGQQGNTPPGATKPAAGQASANAQAQPIDVNALMNAAGLAPKALKKAGPIIQKATGNGNLSATGDDAIDGMLQLMGYNVS